MPASIVFTATELMRRLPFADAPSVEPGLKPNHPNARMKQPSSTIVMSWPGIGFALPSRVYLPIRGPIRMPIASAVTPPTECTTPDPAKSDVAMAEAEVAIRASPASRRPRPSCANKRIGERAHDEGGDDERRVLPALGRRAGDDGQGRVHEDHLEQEHHHDADVIGAAGEHDSPSSRRGPRSLPNRWMVELGVQRRRCRPGSRPRRRRLPGSRNRSASRRACRRRTP